MMLCNLNVTTTEYVLLVSLHTIRLCSIFIYSHHEYKLINISNTMIFNIAQDYVEVSIVNHIVNQKSSNSLCVIDTRGCAQMLHE